VGSVNLSLPSVVATSTLTLAGTVTSQNGSNAGTVADVSLSALESVSSTLYTVPLPPTATQSAATLSVETAASSGSVTCAAGTDCADYTMLVPSGSAYIGAWSSGGATLTVSPSAAAYVVDGIAFVPGSGGTPNCTPSEVQAPAYSASSTGPVQALAFVQCQ
jgi:hypothetical protein